MLNAEEFRAKRKAAAAELRTVQAHTHTHTHICTCTYKQIQKQTHRQTHKLPRKCIQAREFAASSDGAAERTKRERAEGRLRDGEATVKRLEKEMEQASVAQRLAEVCLSHTTEAHPALQSIA
jgi:uncharacterized membrane protein YebE (DUF533 family)